MLGVVSCGRLGDRASNSHSWPDYNVCPTSEFINFRNQFYQIINWGSWRKFYSVKRSVWRDRDGEDATQEKLFWQDWEAMFQDRLETKDGWVVGSKLGRKVGRPQCPTNLPLGLSAFQYSSTATHLIQSRWGVTKKESFRFNVQSQHYSVVCHLSLHCLR